MKRSLHFLIVLVLLALSAQACLPEKRMAARAITTDDTINLCLMDPYIILKENQKTWEIPGFDTIAEDSRDSLLYHNSKFLKLISDSAFIATYTVTIHTELSKLGIHLFSQDSMDIFLASGGKGYLFNIAQMSVEEYIEVIRKTFALDTTAYWDIWCNAVSLNIWYEASILNDTSSKMKVLFGNMYVRDNFKGHFAGDMYTGNIGYEYTMDSIDIKSVYKLAARAGKTHAEYIFDFIMNDQMAHKAKPGDPPKEYMHFDPVKKTYKKAGTHRFVEIIQ